MSQQSLDWTVINGQHSRVRARIEEIAPLLDQQGEFVAEETSAEPQLLRFLVELGALEVVAEEYDRGSHRQRYAWDRAAKATIQTYYERLPKLPCGCHAHIPPGDDAPDGQYRCRYCGAVHDRDTIRAAVDAND